MKSFKTIKTGRAIGFGLFLFALVSCTNTDKATDEKFSFGGKAQGSTYGVIYYASDTVKMDLVEQKVNQVLKTIDDLFSLWVESSALNSLNNTGELKLKGSDALYFKRILELSDSVYNFSDSLFDVSIYPLVKKWGFGKNINDTTIQINDALKLVGFDRVDWMYTNEQLTVSLDSGQSLDFNSIAQGYTVDCIADELLKLGITSYLIEVGGELRIGNRKPNGDLWAVGIDEPKENAESRVLIDTIYTENSAVVTSGSYRKFYEMNGQKFSHSINPKTGFPVNHNLLSITIIDASENCALADAYATAIMVMGQELATKKFEALKAYQLLYIHSENGKFVSDWQHKSVE